MAAALQRLRSAADDGRLEAVCRRRGVALVTALGSAASGAPDARDLDVAVGGVPSEHLLPLIGELLDLTGADAVDLLVLDGAPPTARRNALVGAIPLYEGDSSLFARTQMAAALDFETDWLRDADLRRTTGR